MHLDIAGVGGVVNGSDVPYLAKGIRMFLSEKETRRKIYFIVLGMTGRPTRTLIEVLSRISQSEDLQNMF
jgi:hypothetical protein